jgi:hypothetical protein
MYEDGKTDLCPISDTANYELEAAAGYRQGWADAAGKCAQACNKIGAESALMSAFDYCEVPMTERCAAACERVGKEMGIMRPLTR